MGLLVACFCRTVTEAFLVANVPLFVLMFLSGAMFPLPRVPLFSVAGRPLLLTDLLPLSHAVAAMNKVLTLGAGPGEVAFELAALAVLSVAYYAAGMGLFQRMHLRVR
jgi:ABC-2 type transport system permease protein